MTYPASIETPFAGWRGLPDGNRLLSILLVSVTLVVGLAIFQDFLQAMRRGGAFYFSESLLFKSVWLFFPPILMTLARALRSRKFPTRITKARLAALAILVHLALVPPTVWLVSSLFFDHSYGVVKVFTYTVSNDLLPIIAVYASFVFLLKPRVGIEAATAPDAAPSPRFLVVQSGRQAQRIALDDILHVQSATPYVAIQVGERQHLHLATMAAIGKQLGPQFLRIHRSTRVNLDKVVACTSRLNGDYDLTLVDGSRVRLSRNYAAAFKARFATGPQLKP